MAIKLHYHSNYVCTTREGLPHSFREEDEGPVYNELVFNNEAQIVPAYVVLLDLPESVATSLLLEFTTPFELTQP